MSRLRRHSLRSEWPGDCGHFVVWRAASYYGRPESLRQISYEISPLVAFTGPVTVKAHLARLGIASTFHNDFPTDRIRQKLDEGKPVIAMLNMDTASPADGLTHYVLVVGYDDRGFFFYDSAYWLGAYMRGREAVADRPYFMDFAKFEGLRQTVLHPRQLVGRLERFVGMERFVIVVNERREETIPRAIMLMLRLQRVAERIIEGVGRTAMLFRGLGRSR